jgi:hypothetical protein
MFKRIIRIITALSDGLESSAKSINNVAALGNKLSQDLLDETRRKRKEELGASARGTHVINEYIDESRAARKAKLLQLNREFAAWQATLQDT